MEPRQSVCEDFAGIPHLHQVAEMEQIIQENLAASARGSIEKEDGTEKEKEKRKQKKKSKSSDLHEKNQKSEHPETSATQPAEHSSSSSSSSENTATAPVTVTAPPADTSTTHTPEQTQPKPSTAPYDPTATPANPDPNPTPKANLKTSEETKQKEQGDCSSSSSSSVSLPQKTQNDKTSEEKASVSAGPQGETKTSDPPADSEGQAETKTETEKGEDQNVSAPPTQTPAEPSASSTDPSKRPPDSDAAPAAASDAPARRLSLLPSKSLPDLSSLPGAADEAQEKGKQQEGEGEEADGGAKTDSEAQTKSRLDKFRVAASKAKPPAPAKSKTTSFWESLVSYIVPAETEEDGDGPMHRERPPIPQVNVKAMSRQGSKPQPPPGGHTSNEGQGGAEATTKGEKTEEKTKLVGKAAVPPLPLHRLPKKPAAKIKQNYAFSSGSSSSSSCSSDSLQTVPLSLHTSGVGALGGSAVTAAVGSVEAVQAGASSSSVGALSGAPGASGGACKEDDQPEETGGKGKTSEGKGEGEEKPNQEERKVDDPEKHSIQPPIQEASSSSSSSSSSAAATASAPPAAPIASVPAASSVPVPAVGAAAAAGMGSSSSSSSLARSPGGGLVSAGAGRESTSARLVSIETLLHEILKLQKEGRNEMVELAKSQAPPPPPPPPEDSQSPPPVAAPPSEAASADAAQSSAAVAAAEASAAAAEEKSKKTARENQLLREEVERLRVEAARRRETEMASGAAESLKVQEFQEQVKDWKAKAAESQTRVVQLEEENEDLRKEGQRLRLSYESASKAAEKQEATAAELEKVKGQMGHLKEMESLYQMERRERMKVFNELQDLKGKIRVFVRVRPRWPSEFTEDEAACVEVEDEFCVKLMPSMRHGPGGPPKGFCFDRCFGEEATQMEVFSETQKLTESFIDGYNVCIFAYGQTGSGKTFTMQGNEEHKGLVPRAVEFLFRQLEGMNGKKFEWNVSCHMLELYMDTLVDLLAVSSGVKEKESKDRTEREKDKEKTTSLDIRRDPLTGVVSVPNAVCAPVEDAQAAMRTFRKGSESRQVAFTQMNSESSRSHLFFILFLSITDKSSGKRTNSKMTFVDLAGSERTKKSETTGERQKEGTAINMSLTALGRVISALSSNEKHIPYRNSRLTMLMSDSLGGTAKTLMITNLSPAPASLDETSNSLTYASSVKTITNEVSKNVSSKQVQALQARVKQLEQQLQSAKRLGGSSSHSKSEGALMVIHADPADARDAECRGELSDDDDEWNTRGGPLGQSTLSHAGGQVSSRRNNAGGTDRPGGVSTERRDEGAGLKASSMGAALAAPPGASGGTSSTSPSSAAARASRLISAATAATSFLPPAGGEKAQRRRTEMIQQQQNREKEKEATGNSRKSRMLSQRDS
uniref:Kinesin motor domain-containing protein n=1 Tax=Chromera velia CCMP2878 TaxID=1169474 RepID=A0A0G4F7J4_9ALVE|eukprot:Cvel_15545.t1-p1 / transcript=Cvel_15545.t1 / gene=Cvel_15545 / organism=Chromera_velia_CCMP2878 / gene_product=Kinesin-like calmodulin-binding protein, putative / transcript_product=Kinesin-like calmodulin-binding protein, putative / location=Cvel_scaffold1155:10886-21016(+) / protein_length=1393 / sequence_SO=supercontig / SO=protein_coding / is_pseudo=false